MNATAYNLMRAEFEAFCTARSISIKRRDTGRYHAAGTHYAFVIWELAFEAGQRAAEPGRNHKQA